MSNNVKNRNHLRATTITRYLHLQMKLSESSSTVYFALRGFKKHDVIRSKRTQWASMLPGFSGALWDFFRYWTFQCTGRIFRLRQTLKWPTSWSVPWLLNMGADWDAPWVHRRGWLDNGAGNHYKYWLIHTGTHSLKDRQATQFVISLCSCRASFG